MLIDRGYNLAAYPYKVYFLPPNACSWVGQGYIGCDGSYDCRSWIAGAYWDNPQVGGARSLLGGRAGGGGAAQWGERCWAPHQGC